MVAMTPEGSLAVADEECLWVTCRHVLEHTAEEVWTREDRIAMCPKCARLSEAEVEAMPLSEFAVLHPECLLELVCATLVVGREFIIRDVIAKLQQGSDE